MLSGPGPTPEPARPGKAGSFVAAVLDHPATGLLTQLWAALSVGWLAWRVFFHFAPYLWAQLVVDPGSKFFKPSSPARRARQRRHAAPGPESANQ